jgi:hypothetical protein
MTAVSKLAAARGQSLCVRQLAELETVFDAAFSVIVWQRSRPSISSDAFAPWFARHGRFIREIRASECRAHLIAGLCDLPPASALACDLASLGDLFATLMGAERSGLRVEVTGQRMCPRLHVDNVALRMTSGLLRPGRVVRQMQAFDVGLLTSARWPGNEGYGAIHPSPAVPPGETRILVSWDAH